MMTCLAKFRTALSLPATADEEAVADAVEALAGDGSDVDRMRTAHALATSIRVSRRATEIRHVVAAEAAITRHGAEQLAMLLAS